MKILHVAYSLNEQSAACRLAESQAADPLNTITFLLGRRSSSQFVFKRQLYPNFTSIFGIFSHLIDHLFRKWSIRKGEIFSMGLEIPIKTLFFRRLIRRQKPDVLHVHWGGYSFLPVSSLIRLSSQVGIRTIVTIHDYYYFTGGCHIPMSCAEYEKNCMNCPLASGYIGRAWVRYQRKKKNEILPASKITFVSPSTYVDQFINNAYHGVSSKVIPNTTGHAFRNDLRSMQEKMTLYRQYRCANDNTPTIIAVGVKRFPLENKGADIMLEITRRMTASSIAFNLITVGEYMGLSTTGTHLHYNELSVERLRDLYIYADLCLVTSRFETFSQVTLESIQSATPVVAFDLTGPKDIIRNGKTGFFAKSFDVDSMYEAVVRNLDHKFLNTDQMIHESLNFAQHFSPEHTVSLHDHLYSSKGELVFK